MKISYFPILLKLQKIQTRGTDVFLSSVLMDWSFIRVCSIFKDFKNYLKTYFSFFQEAKFAIFSTIISWRIFKPCCFFDLVWHVLVYDFFKIFLTQTSYHDILMIVYRAHPEFQGARLTTLCRLQILVSLIPSLCN